MREELKMNMKIETANKINLQGFLTELGELSKKYGIEIGGCGCCGSPYLDYMGENMNEKETATDLSYDNGAYEVAIEGYRVIVRGSENEIHK